MDVGQFVKFTGLFLLLGKSNCQTSQPSGHREYRLVDGHNDCSGQLEAQHGDTWGSVCEIDGDFKAAKVLCKELQCGEAVPSLMTYTRRPGPIWTEEIHCIGNESRLLDCTRKPSMENCSEENPPAIQCKVEVRLSGGTNCTGRVEVKYNGEWGGILFIEESKHLSTVIHRQLGCITPNANFLTNASEFGNIKTTLWFSAINCSGEESYLSQCRFYSFKINEFAAVFMTGLTSPGYRDYRLVDGPNECSGQLEAKQGTTWGSFCEIDTDLRTANVICRELQCGEAVPSLGIYTRGPGLIWTDEIHCVGNESRLLDCTTVAAIKNCTKENPSYIQCKVEVRLSGGANNCTGRVEVKYKGEWGGVFFNEAYKHLSTVVHRQLGCLIPNATFLTNATEFGVINMKLWFAAIVCSGEESYLSQCRFYPFELHEFSSDQMAGLTHPGYRDYRLVDGPNECSGHLEAIQGNTWGSFCEIDTDLRTASVVCRELQCGEAVPSLNYTRKPGLIWMDSIHCVGNESRLLDCIKAPGMKNCTKHNHYIQCKGMHI